MFRFLRRAATLALGCSLGLTLTHAPQAHASAEAGMDHHGSDARSAMAAPSSEHGANDCKSSARREHDAPCDDAPVAGCASMGACPLSMVESVGSAFPVRTLHSAVPSPRLTVPLRPQGAPETPPPRA